MKILSFDIESCTGNPTDGSLCSFGYCLSNDFDIIEKKDILVNPKPKKFKLGKSGEEARIKLAYSEEEFRSAPRFPAAYRKIRPLFEGVLCVGFAVGNDVRYLNNACECYKLPVITYRYLDVQMLAGYIDEENKGLGLSRLGEKYGIEFAEHKSDDDAFATLMLLQKLCALSGKTVEELIDYYEIVLGTNDKNGIKNMYSVAQIYNRKGLKRSKAQSGILLHEFLEDMKRRPRVDGILKGKRVCFNGALEKDDIMLSRRLIKRVYDLGGKYVTDLTGVNLYIAEDDAEQDGRLRKIRYLHSAGQRVKIVAESEFLKKIGDVEEIEFDDVSVLVKHAREKAENRMKNKSNVAKYGERARMAVSNVGTEN